MKYSKPRKLRADGRIFSAGRPSKISESQQFWAICEKAWLLYREHGRRRALEYLQWQHPWLKYYLGGTGPASGTLLDQIIKSKQ
jgi:hypothetical protein